MTSTRCVRVAVVAVVATSFFTDVHARPPENEQDDRLTADERHLIGDLTRRQMPELVETLLAGRSESLQPYIARAYGQVGLSLLDPALRSAFCEKSLEWFRRCLPALDNASRLSDEVQRVESAEWLVEYADLVVRHECATDLDNYELTSGLDFNRARLTDRLREAGKRYGQADDVLRPLVMGLRTQEEKYLLLGLTERIERLAEGRMLSAAWVEVYLGMVSEPSAPGRGAHLADALAGFDQVARDSRDKDRKYNALIGAGVALRESGRANEAASSLERVIVSTADTSVVARARYEKVRTLLASGQFDAARDEIKALSALSRFPDAVGATFYFRLAPLLEAHSYALQSAARVENSPEMLRLRETAMEKFATIAKQGGPWPGIVETYLSNLSGPTKSLTQMSVEELRTSALRWMAKSKYAEAVPILSELTSRKQSTAEDSLNLGVCLFQIQKLADAAAHFEKAEIAGSGDVSDRAAEYAYRCRKKLVQDTKNRESLRALARTALRLASLHGSNSLAAEAAYAAGVAFQEAGDYAEARKAYLEVGQDNPKYWWARRGIAECLSADSELVTLHRENAASRRDAAMEWARLVEGLSAGKPVGIEAVPSSWVTEARLQAAALFAHDRVGDYPKALELLRELPENLDARVIRLRCHRMVGDMAAASNELNGLLNERDRAKSAPAIMGMIADIQRQAAKFSASARSSDVEKFAAQALPILEKVGAWLGEERQEYNTIRSVRVSVLRAAGRASEALEDAEKLVVAEPDNGNRLQMAALLLEQIAQTAAPSERSALFNRAEAYWARLLEDPTLRDIAPQIYWEARYQWLLHQVRHGKAADVIKAIEAERAWFPELGGPPWQGKLVELMETARSSGVSKP
ncbi:MAG: tetratricopeptide repeat protein [Planctomycetes bacterium]|nr:tetratricopeptide repeat protein [Planctomycetota bacterium]